MGFCGTDVKWVGPAKTAQCSVGGAKNVCNHLKCLPGKHVGKVDYSLATRFALRGTLPIRSVVAGVSSSGFFQTIIRRENWPNRRNDPIIEFANAGPAKYNAP